jgi:hypothetical protein
MLEKENYCVISSWQLAHAVYKLCASLLNLIAMVLDEKLFSLQTRQELSVSNFDILVY